jgi:predicted HTH domain antitoxin
MDTISVQINVPRDVFGAMDVPEVEIGQRLQELVALELVREGRISTGKGAEMLGISKWAFVQRMARHGIEYFSESPEELSEQLEAVQRLLEARQA